jgi:hypothetical protein
MNMEMYQSVILPLLYMGVKPGVPLRKVSTLIVFVNWALKEIFHRKR